MPDFTVSFWDRDNNAVIAPAGLVFLPGRAETPNVAVSGLPLTVWPNTLQRIYVLWSYFDLSASISTTMSVKAWYRPRRASF